MKAIGLNFKRLKKKMKKKLNSPVKKFKEDGDKLDGEEIKGKNKTELQLKIDKVFKENEY